MALDGGVSPCPMLILRKDNVTLSNLRNAPVTQSISRNNHVPCDSFFPFFFKVKFMSLKPRKVHVAMSSLGVKGHSYITRTGNGPNSVGQLTTTCGGNHPTYRTLLITLSGIII